MSVQVDIHVRDLSVVLASYTRVLIERASTETGFLPAGASQIASVTLVTGQSDYVYPDTAGLETDWYRSRYSNAGGTQFSGYSVVREGLPALLTLAELRQHVKTELVDEALQRLLDDAELAIIGIGGRIEDATVDDTATRRLVAIELVKLSIGNNPGLASQSLGEWSESYRSNNYLADRASLLALVGGPFVA
jgi:hypothetical protein